MRRIFLLIPLILAMAIAILGAHVTTAHADSCGSVILDDDGPYWGKLYLPGDGTVQEHDGTDLSCQGGPWYVTEVPQWSTGNGVWANAQYNGVDYLDRKPDTGTWTGGIAHDFDLYVPRAFDYPVNLACNYYWRLRFRAFVGGNQLWTMYDAANGSITPSC